MWLNTKGVSFWQTTVPLTMRKGDKTPLTSDQMKCTVFKITDFSGLKIFGNIWNNISAQFNKIHNIGLVIFRHFNVEKLHIISLNKPRNTRKQLLYLYIFGQRF